MVCLIPSFGEIITAIDKAISSINGNSVSTLKILWLVIFFSAERHAWAVSKDWRLGKLLLLKEHREWESTTILGINFLNFHRIILKEEVKSVVLVTTIVTVVLPKDFEGENLAIIIKERFQVLVGAATFQFNFVVVLVFSKIRRVLLEVDHSSVMLKWIIWKCFGAANINSFVGIESLGKVISIENTEDARVDIKIGAKFQIGPIIGSAGWIWQFVSL